MLNRLNNLFLITVFIFSSFLAAQTSTGTCEDFDNGSGGAWHDSDGPQYNCEWYADNGCPNYGDNYVNFGYSGLEACCECGGGLGGDGGGGNDVCGGCLNDYSAYGSQCCDTAWETYGLTCASLEANQNWDCSGCSCPGDLSCEEQGLITCENGSEDGTGCAVNLDECCGEFGCVDNSCSHSTWGSFAFRWNVR